jgi:hypothetical protein
LKSGTNTRRRACKKQTTQTLSMVNFSIKNEQNNILGKKQPPMLLNR